MVAIVILNEGSLVVHRNETESVSKVFLGCVIVPVALILAAFFPAIVHSYPLATRCYDNIDGLVVPTVGPRAIDFKVQGFPV